MAAGAVAAAFAGKGLLELGVVGGFFGVLPDFDLVLSKRVHRCAGSHSLLAAGIMAFAWYVFSVLVMRPQGLLEEDGTLIPSVVVAFAAAFMHAAEDSVTRQGCRLLYPLSSRRYRGPVRYDDVAANALLSLCAAAVILVSSADLRPLP